MLIAPKDDLSAHAVSVHPPTVENPTGYHRLIGGSVELGESHRDAIVREVHEELGATIDDLAFLAAVENIFLIDGRPGHEIVFLYSGRLEPEPASLGASLIESDGSIVPIAWRPCDDTHEAMPLYPTEAGPWVQRILSDR